MPKKPKSSTVVTYQGKSYKRGQNVTKGAYRLLNTSNGKYFVGSLIDTINFEGKRIALFSVPK